MSRLDNVTFHVNDRNEREGTNIPADLYWIVARSAPSLIESDTGLICANFSEDRFVYWYPRFMEEICRVLKS